jgi:Uma2 family endonuclease
LVIEVAVGNAELERAMASIYAEAGVEEYWINLDEKHAIEVYRLRLMASIKRR